jgi:hypothetical protein
VDDDDLADGAIADRLVPDARADRDHVLADAIDDGGAVELGGEPLRRGGVARARVVLDERAEAVQLGAGDVDAGGHEAPRGKGRRAGPARRARRART